MGRELFRKGNEEGTTNPSKENDWGRRGRAASAHLKSEAVAAVTGVAGGRGRVGVERGGGGVGGSTLTWSFGALVERAEVQSGCHRSRERAGEEEGE
jgi:hypothetical protein